jgi:preprotein translocase subunit SecG
MNGTDKFFNTNETCVLLFIIIIIIIILSFLFNNNNKVNKNKQPLLF